ncbi:MULTISPECIES: hypothetical protein [unclassified Marinovum]
MMFWEEGEITRARSAEWTFTASHGQWLNSADQGFAREDAELLKNIDPERKE